MIYLKPVLILLLILFSGFSLENKKPAYLTKWVVTKGCSLKVGGSTNINKFNCIIANYSKPDTLTFYSNNTSESLKITGSLKLDVQNFNCFNPVMTGDLRKTLKSKEFPKLTIRLLSLSRYPEFNNKLNTIKGVVTIELAGTTKRFEVDYRFVSDGIKSINLIARRQVKFSDFDIVPPRRIGGMIQTNNELDVEFNLNMKVID
ncbi:YceI family protein [Daejeonella oryzae]|uniref:YceI family protein n=1 Tax=Daejeonella oryzae TaxID=1122943 RepID=UPI0004134B9A|nr:YceI family protein [Daejeonella oryzae]